MADIQFQEDRFVQQSYASAPPARGQSFFARLAMASGLAKTEKEVTPVLTGAAVLIFLFAAGVWFLSQHHTAPAETPNSPTWPKPVTNQ